MRLDWCSPGPHNSSNHSFHHCRRLWGRSCMPSRRCTRGKTCTHSYHPPLWRLRCSYMQKHRYNRVQSYCLELGFRIRHCHCHCHCRFLHLHPRYTADSRTQQKSKSQHRGRNCKRTREMEWYIHPRGTTRRHRSRRGYNQVLAWYNRKFPFHRKCRHHPCH